MTSHVGCGRRKGKGSEAEETKLIYKACPQGWKNQNVMEEGCDWEGEGAALTEKSGFANHSVAT